VLRAIVSQAVEKLQLSTGPNIDSSGGGNGLGETSSLKRHESSLHEEQKNSTVQYFDDWEDPQTYIVALENVEAWIFNRIIESVWWQVKFSLFLSAVASAKFFHIEIFYNSSWLISFAVSVIQTLTPHMQPAAAKSSGSRKTHARRYGLGDQEQGNFSIDLWKKAFKDACERLCPLRAGGHECGCLPLLAKLVC
jgi:hypothetical protein